MVRTAEWLNIFSMTRKASQESDAWMKAFSDKAKVLFLGYCKNLEDRSVVEIPLAEIVDELLVELRKDPNYIRFMEVHKDNPEMTDRFIKASFIDVIQDRYEDLLRQNDMPVPTEAPGFVAEAPTSPEEIKQAIPADIEMKLNNYQEAIKKLEEIKKTNTENPAAVDAKIDDLRKKMQRLQMEAAKAAVIERLGKRYRGHGDVEDEERWMEKAFEEEGEDPAKKMLKKEEDEQEESEEAPATEPEGEKIEQEVIPVETVDPDVKINLEEEPVESTEEERIDIIRRIFELNQNPQGNEEEISKLKRSLMSLYAGRKPGMARTAAEPLLLEDENVSAHESDIKREKELAEHPPRKQPEQNPEKAIPVSGPPETKESIAGRIQDAAMLAMSNLFNDQKRLDEFTADTMRAAVEVRKATGDPDVNANKLYEHHLFRDSVDSVANMSWKIFRENAMKSFLKPYEGDTEFIKELEDFFIGSITESLKDYANNNILKEAISEEMAAPTHSQEKKDAAEIYRSLISSIDKLLPRWKRDNEGDLERYREEAFNRAMARAEHILSHGPMEKTKQHEMLENPDKGALDAFTEDILNTDFTKSGGLVMSVAEYINNMVTWNMLTSEEANAMKSALSSYVATDLTQEWAKPYREVAKATGIPYKGQEAL